MKHILLEAYNLCVNGYQNLAWEKIQEVENIGVEQALNYDQTEIDKYNFNKGWYLIRNGKYNEGSQLLEAGRFVNAYGGQFLKTDKPLWNPEEYSPLGKTLLVKMEGGIGDELINIRFVKNIKQRGFSKVYVLTSTNISVILSRVEGVDAVYTDENDLPEFDFWLPSFSIGWLSGASENNISGEKYLHANQAHVDIFKDLFKTDKIKVGIRWSGNPAFEDQQHRVFPKEYMFELASIFPDIQFYSFQRDADTENIPDNIINLENYLMSWEDTASAISHMDLVISSCTSVAHLSAGLGIPTFIIVPINPYYIWAEGIKGEPGPGSSTTTRWYNSVTLCRQEYKDSWHEPFINIVKLISGKFKLATPTIKNFDAPIKRLNIGCGENKVHNCLNVDKQKSEQTDIVFDFSTKQWDIFNDNEFDIIFANHSLNYIEGDINNIIKEMYRISKPGAVWEIAFHHHLSSFANSDPLVVRKLTADTFMLYNKKADYYCKENSISHLAKLYDVDIEVVNTSCEFFDFWLQKVNSNEQTTDDLYAMSNIYNNVVKSVKLKIRVNK